MVTSTEPTRPVLRRPLAVATVMVAVVLAVIGYFVYSSHTKDHLTVDSFASLMKEKGVVLLDVRTREEFVQGHLPGARNMDATALSFRTRLKDLDPDATYAVYCCTGKRSATVLQTMKDAGFSHVQDLDGGYSQWVRQGMTITTA